MFRLLCGWWLAPSLVAAALTFSLLADVQADGPQKVATVEGITEYQFDNGFRLLLFPDPSKPTVTVNLTVLVGSRHEGYGEAGMAHLLEHMVFKGTPTHANPPQELRDRGAQFNGTTNVDRTNYFETLRASDENLEFAIRFEADRMLNSFVRREDLISEMTVVRNEFERSENSPESLLGKRMMAAAYEWHNYGKTTIGNRSDIERVPIDNLQDFYRRYYQPDNAVLIVAGKFDEAKALAYAQKYFGSLPRPERKLPSTYTEEPPQDGERLVTLRRVGDVALVEALYHVPAGSHADFAALELLGMILDDQPSGRLYQALVETKKASAVSSGAYGRHDPSVFDITAEVSKGVERDEVRDIMLATIQTVIDKGVTEEEVQRARQNSLNQRREQASNTSSLAVSLSSWVAMGDWRLYFLHRDRIEKVTAADVQRVAAQYLIASNRTLGYFIPAETPEMVTVPSTPDVAELVKDYEGRPPVAAVAEFDYSFANIEKHTQRSSLPGGVKVALLPKPTRDEVVNLSLTLRYGNLENLKGQRAVASLLPGLMARGTKQLSFQQLEDEQTRLDIEISGSSVGAGVAAFQVRAKKSTLPAALDLLRQVLREPALDAAELELLKAPRIAALEQAQTDPQSLATDTLTRTLSPYPDDDIRFSPPAEEEIAEVKAVTIEQVRKLYEQYLGATEGELIVIGDFEAEPALKLAGEMLADWKAKQPVARIEQVAFLDVKGQHESILTPDKANAVYFGGEQIGMNDQDADYPSLLLGSYVLGGSSLSSRLGDRVRQKEGLSYGVGSFFSAGSEDKVAQFMLYAIANPTNIPKVEKAIREEIEKLLKEGIPAEEFSRAQQGLLQARELNRSSDSYVVTRLRRSMRMDQTLAFDEQLDTRLAGLEPGEVQAALQTNLDPKRLVIVVAGDFPSNSESK